ncbi:MAG TPA: chemotaxis protein CheW [Gemmatimonadaceae bacterium]|nr:chemotaxis protein CheW [Gemmatimonadaceae bacterium]
MDSSTQTLEVPTTPALLFRSGDAVYGVDSTQIQEIIPILRVTRLPGAPPFVRGLINVRGTIVTLIDLGLRLEPSRAPIVDGSVLLARFRDRTVGLVVDEVLDVRGVVVEESPEGSTSGVVRGLSTVDARAVVILDLDAMMHRVLLS